MCAGPNTVHNGHWFVVCGFDCKDCQLGGWTWGWWYRRSLASSSDPLSPNRLRRLQDASKAPPDGFCFPSFFHCFFGSFFCRFWMPIWYQKSMKIHEKSMPGAIPILASFFHRFWIDLCLIFRSMKPQNLFKLCWFYNIFLLF